MIKIDPTLLILLGEVVLGLVVVLGIFIVVLMKRGKRDRAAVAELRRRIEKNADSREQHLVEALSDVEGNVEASDQSLAKSLVDKENTFYEKIIEIYMQRNSSAMKSVDKLLHDYSSSYLDALASVREKLGSEEAALSEEAAEQLARMEAEAQRMASEVEALKQENERLSKELAEAYAEIEQAMREYSVAFRTGSSDGGKVVGGSLAAGASAAAAAAAAATVLTEPAGAEPEVVEAAIAEPESVEPEEAPDEPLDLEDLSDLGDEFVAFSEEEAEEIDEVEEEISENIADLGLLDEGELASQLGAADIEEPLEMESDAEMAAEEMIEEFDLGAGDAAEAPEEDDIAALEAALEAEVDFESEPESEPPILDEAVEVDTDLDQFADLEAALEAEDLASGGDELPIVDDVLDLETSAEETVLEAEESIDEPVYVEDMLKGLGDDESLEDVVLQAMAEEEAAARGEPELEPETVADESEDEPTGPVIDLAADDELDLSEFDIGASDETSMPVMEEAPEIKHESVDDNDIDEDELLAQLEEMNDDFDLSVLDGLDDFGDLLDDEENKKEE